MVIKKRTILKCGWEETFREVVDSKLDLLSKPEIEKSKSPSSLASHMHYVFGNKYVSKYVWVARLKSPRLRSLLILWGQRLNG